MGLHITPAAMTLTPTGPVVPDGAATTAAAEYRGGAWQVTGHPGRRFTRDQAITALTLAELLTDPTPANEMRLVVINDLRAELDLPPLTTADAGTNTGTGTTRDAASSAKTTAAPRHPARSNNSHEVTPS
ncbi:hypothetical protein [Sphaerisporangium rhizosphaerae]|uniref:Uncharacterized protein n=1 Tax=Sphaerisporangium rhizosphaerae TaxID=2269375 RepID=A0ABW2NZI3_9ACTN